LKTGASKQEEEEEEEAAEEEAAEEEAAEEEAEDSFSLQLYLLPLSLSLSLSLLSLSLSLSLQAMDQLDSTCTAPPHHVVHGAVGDHLPRRLVARPHLHDRAATLQHLEVAAAQVACE
jgi:hypothetical protein